MNDRALQFYFDKTEYFHNLEYVLKTMDDINFSSFDFILNITPNVFESPEYLEFISLSKKMGVDFKTFIMENRKITGIVQWLTFPKIGDYKYVISVDVDVLFLPKTNLNDVIDEVESKDGLIFGIQEHLTGKRKVRLSKKRISETSILFPNVSENYSGNFINGGFLVCKAKEIKEKMPNFWNNAEKLVSDYCEKCKEMNINDSDQSFIYFTFFNNIGFLESKWNIRFSHKDDIANFYTNENRNGILHYCIKEFDFKTREMKKINYIDYYLKGKSFGSDLMFKLNRKFLRKCKPNIWFPFRKFTKLGKRDAKLNKSLKILCDLLVEGEK